MNILMLTSTVISAGAAVCLGRAVLKALKKRQEDQDDAPPPALEEENDDIENEDDAVEQEVSLSEQEMSAEEQKERDEEEKQADEALAKDEENEKKEKEKKKAAEKEEKDKKEREEAEEEEKKKEKTKKDREKDSLNLLFDMEQTAAPTRKTAETAQRETKTTVLGQTRPDLLLLRDQNLALTAAVVDLSGKGLNPAQMINNLASRGQKPPADEIMPIIDAVRMIVKHGKDSARAAARVGEDSALTVNAALKALAKGEPQAAFRILEKIAAEKTTAIKAAQTPQEKLAVMREIGDALRAKSTLERPFDFDRSFDSLAKARQFDPSNPLTEALVARAYYETGKTKTAKKIFAELARQSDEKTAGFSMDYAREMMPKIASERAFSHAGKIRKEYDERLASTSGRQKTSQRMAAQRIASYSNEEQREFIRQ